LERVESAALPIRTGEVELIPSEGSIPLPSLDVGPESMGVTGSAGSACSVTVSVPRLRHFSDRHWMTVTCVKPEAIDDDREASLVTWSAALSYVEASTHRRTLPTTAHDAGITVAVRQGWIARREWRCADRGLVRNRGPEHGLRTWKRSPRFRDCGVSDRNWRGLA
jgi:hypothetical protein